MNTDYDFVRGVSTEHYLTPTLSNSTGFVSYTFIVITAYSNLININLLLEKII